MLSQRPLQRPLLCLISLLILILLSATEAQARKCPLGSFDTGSKCKKCRPGTYQNKVGRKSCKKCPADTFTPAKGVIARQLCQTCPPDSISKPGSKKCTKCPRGKVRDCGKCVRCPKGTSLGGCDGCYKCFPDSFTTKANQDSCTQCPEGMRANRDRTGCQSGGCLPGFQFGSHECDQCTASAGGGQIIPTFKNESMAKCEKCPPRTTILDFSKPPIKCEKCPPGMFLTDVLINSDDSIPKCQKCPPGSTTRGFGKPMCREKGKPCPSYTFEDKDGDCEVCDPNFRYDPNNKRCVKCKPNEILPGNPREAHLQTKCKKCRRGELRSFFGHCVCPAGQAFRRGRCRLCPAGSISSHGEYCSRCTHFQFSKVGATECTRCPEGTSSVQSKGKKCQRLRCPKGFIGPPVYLASIFPRDVCISMVTGCPKGFVGLGHTNVWFLCADKRGNVVCPKDYIFNKKDDCISCSIGHRIVKTSKGTLKCKKCPISKPRSPGGLSRKCRPCKKGTKPTGFVGCTPI